MTEPPATAYPAGGDPLIRDVGAGSAAAAREILRTAERVGGATVPIVDAQVDADGRVIVTMAPRRGEWLDALLARAAPLIPTAAARLVCQAAAALRAAHAAGVIHGRLDPSWIFLREDGADLQVEIGGFGVAAVPPDERALNLYLAPEQARPTPRSDERSDIFALGAILYTALAGAAPLAHVRGAAQHRAALLVRPAPDLQEVAPWVPPRLAEIVHGLLIKDPHQRCPSLDELVRALEPRAGGGQRLRAAMLAPLTEEQRAQRASTARPPASWADVRAAEAHVEGSADGAPDPLLGATVGERHRIVRLLGRGGMADVYEAESPDGRAAVKLIHEQKHSGVIIDGAGSRRLAREARAARAVQHPNVVRVLDVDVDRRLARPYIVMELLAGRDLGSVVKAIGAIAPTTAARIFVQMCRGLAAVHRQGIVHRDVKPSNVFLHERDGEIIPKVCDFGLAKLVGIEAGDSNSLTQTGMLLGSPRYMSPEQARDARAVDERSDLWSAAAALHEVLSGVRFWGANRRLSDIVVDVCSKEPPPLVELAPWVDAGLVVVVHRGLSRDPAARFATADEMADALEPFTGGTTRVTRGDLQGAERAPGALAASQPTRLITDRGSGSGSGDSRPPSQPVAAPAPRAARGWIAVVAAAVVVAALGLVAARGFGWLGGGPREVRVAIEPPDALVTVDRVARAAPAGVLVLRGEPGETFAVQVSAGGRRVDRTVTITEEGKALPELIRVGGSPP